MKKIGFLSFFFILTVSAFGRQFLWSTLSDKAERFVPINNVTREILEFYDQYELYLDYSGFSKDRFIESFDYGFDDWSWLYDINELTVFALWSNSGRGSIVMVMCISKNNVNTIIFSNNYEPGCILNHSTDRERFSRWFRTLLN